MRYHSTHMPVALFTQPIVLNILYAVTQVQAILQDPYQILPGVAVYRH
jgi:hypothetical protein